MKYRGFVGSTQDFCLLIDGLLQSEEREKSTHEEDHFDRNFALVRDEGYPIKVFLENGLMPVVSVEIPESINTNFDALLGLANGERFTFEVTRVKDGQLERYRARYLDLHGVASLSGVTTQGFYEALRDGKEYWGEASNVDEAILDLAGRIQKAIDKKKAKVYPTNTFLIVAIDQDFKEENFFRIAAQSKVSEVAPFAQIFLVSSNTRKAAVIS